MTIFGKDPFIFTLIGIGLTVVLCILQLLICIRNRRVMPRPRLLLFFSGLSLLFSLLFVYLWIFPEKVAMDDYKWPYIAWLILVVAGYIYTYLDWVGIKHCKEIESLQSKI